MPTTSAHRASVHAPSTSVQRRPLILQLRPGGFWYVLTNIAGTPPLGSQAITEGRMGIIVDMVVSTVCLVFASTVIGCSGMLAFVGELPDRLGLTTVGRGVAALLFAIPAATLGGCAI
eukprot:COSAG06_NODE_7341_length_2539_cov_8.811885_2_plen_117_part_01